LPTLASQMSVISGGQLVKDQDKYWQRDGQIVLNNTSKKPWCVSKFGENNKMTLSDIATG